MKIMFTLLLCITTACSFQKSTDGVKGSNNNSFSNEIHADSDGDGVTDNDELQRKTDPFVADVPTFTGELFQEMKVSTYFYNSNTNTESNASFVVRKNFLTDNGSPYEERDYLSNGSLFVTEQHVLLSKKSDSKVHILMAPFDQKDLHYHSVPRMNDLKIFPYSEKISNLSKGSEYERIEFEINNSLNFIYGGAKTYSNVVIDLYWFDDQTQQFNLIGSNTLDGTFEFSKSYFVPLSFKTNTKSLVEKVSQNGARGLYLKIRDFKILEINRFYTQLLGKVTAKSIPVLFNDGEIQTLKYIGLNGSTKNLNTILDTALDDEIQIANSSILRIGNKNNYTTFETDPYGDQVLGDKHWTILTNDITNNPFTYSFSPRNIISLLYLTKGSTFGLTPTYYGTSINSSNPQTIKTILLTRKNLKELRLNLRPKSITGPSTAISNFVPCNQTALSKLCFKYETSLKTMNGVQGIQAAALIYLSVNNKEFRLDQMIENKTASFRMKNSEVLEVKFNDSFYKEIPSSDSLTITFSIRPTKVISCNGLKICESFYDECENLKLTPPKCDSKNEFETYRFKDSTTIIFHPVSGELFISIEYL